MLVKSTKTDSRVLLWERHPRHPGGETFIANDGRITEVGETQRIAELLRDGSLVEVSEQDAPSAAAGGSRAGDAGAPDESGTGGEQPPAGEMLTAEQSAAAVIAELGTAAAEVAEQLERSESEIDRETAAAIRRQLDALLAQLPADDAGDVESDAAALFGDEPQPATRKPRRARQQPQQEP